MIGISVGRIRPDESDGRGEQQHDAANRLDTEKALQRGESLLGYHLCPRHLTA
jgi:hypothetical protein